MGKKAIAREIALTLGGDPQSWQCISEREDAAGQPVREFASVVQGLTVLTVEAKVDGSARIGKPQPF